MIPPEIVTKYSGPPGTGKSTTLLNVVESLLSSGVDPEHIVYTTFTRAGAYEARDRACARFKLPVQRLPYFKTLHSLCYNLLPTSDVMGARDWNTLGKELRLYFSASGTLSEEGSLLFRTKGDVLMSLWLLSRLTLKTIDEIWNKRESFKGPEILRIEFDRFIATCQNYKTTFGKIDYADMLEKWLTDGPDIHADYVIVDEAQDLSALQWKVVEKLCAHAKKVYVAGDDDQCIHEWNGAAPQNFIQLAAADYQVLPQSYRIPASVHKLAGTIIRRVKTRLTKEYFPRTDPGSVNYITDLENVDMSKGSWLLLAYNQYLLEEYEKYCRRKGYYFTRSGAAVVNDAKVIDAIQAWNALIASDQTKLPVSRLKGMYLCMSQCNRVKRGFKTVINAAQPDRLLSYRDLINEFGLCTPRILAWHEALDMIPKDQMCYLKAVDASGSFKNPPTIRISTIHGAKGQEADHVILKPDMSPRTFESFINNPDPEHRVFYVAVTRAKESLFLLPAQNELAYPI